MDQPIKYNAKSEAIPLIIVIASLLLGGYFYSHFPDRVATHWNFAGQANGYSGKFTGAFGLPLLLVGIYTLFTALPFLDPKSEHYRSFSSIYFLFRGLILVALFAIFVILGMNNLGYHIAVNLVVPMIVGLLLIVLGHFMGRIRSNWFMGVRTPWTLSSERVWEKTNRFGGRALMIFGLVIIVGPLLPKTWAITAFVAGALLVAFGSVVYSYVLYRKEKNQR
jgi:uncharacterized membrane protein